MMYISTDYVFDGQGTKAWKPDCREYKPLNIYGKTKLNVDHGSGHEPLHALDLMELPSWRASLLGCIFLDRYRTESIHA